MFMDGVFEIGHVTVSDPERKSVGLGINPFVVYKIRTEALSGAVVQRRYNDFDWLHEAFIHQFPGAIVPHIPEKQALNRFDEDFIEMRRKKLEIFINRVVSHKLLMKSPYLEVFLLANDAKLAQEKSKEKASRNTSTIAWLTNQVGVSTLNSLNPADMMGSENDVRDDVDEKFYKSSLRIKKLHAYTNQLAEAAVLLVKSAANSSLALSHAGSGLSSWGRDDEDPALAARLSSAGVSFTALALESGKFAQAQMESLEEPFLDCVAQLAAAVAAFERRDQVRSELARCRKELLGSRKDGQNKAENNEEAARAKLEAVSNMLSAEYTEFELHRIPEIMRIVFSFSKIQAEYYTKLNKASSELMDKLVTN